MEKAIDYATKYKREREKISKLKKSGKAPTNRIYRNGDLAIKAGNKKIDNSVLIFNLPAVKTCPRCITCAPTCYALRDEKGRFGKVISESRERNYKESLSEQFVSKMVVLIKKTKKTVFRIHESGDFYSQEYADKWSEIARQLPHIQFFTYSKSPYRPNAENINIVESILPDGSINFGDLGYIQEKAKMFNAALCPCGIEKESDYEKTCGNKCTLCETNKHVVFLKH